MTRYDQRFAWGGFGAVGTEGICTDQALLQGYAHQPGLTGEVRAHAWNPVVSGIKANSALVIALVMHVGAHRSSRTEDSFRNATSERSCQTPLPIPR